MAAVSITVLPILILCMFVTMFVVVFVSRDANKRNMNALVWALVAALAPLFLGLIIYLICRKPLVDLQCPRCGTGIAKSDRNCPQCGYNFLTQCPECQFPVQKGWNTCPSCGTALPKDYGQPVRAYKKDNSIVALIIAVILALVVLFFAISTVFKLNMGGSNYHESHGYTGFEGLYNITAEDMAGNTAIGDWIATCGDNTDAHVLLSTESGTCLIYLPKQEQLLQSNLSVEYFDNTKCYLSIYVDTTPYEDKYDYDFFLYELEVFEDTDVEVFINGWPCDSTVTMTDKDISIESWGGQENE